MANQTILISGATGDTANRAIRDLVLRGLPVRALVHQKDARSDSLAALGVEVVLGDLLNLNQVRAAMVGVRSACFVYPLAAGLLDAVTYFALAAKEAGVSSLVNVSQRTARSDAVSHAAQNHWVSERVFDWCGVPVTHLRPTLFDEWLLYPFQLPFIVQKGVISLPAGNGRHSVIAAIDIGRVMAAVLAEPEAHFGQTYHLYGPAELDHTQIAAEVSRAIGRTIRYDAISLEEYGARLTSFGLPPYQVQHITAVMADYQKNMLNGTNDLVERLTGKPPMSIAEFAKLHEKELNGVA